MPSMNSTSSPLTRSSTDRKISGVAGGLAAHLGVDPVLVRVGFAVSILFSGAGLLAYLAMLALVPSDDAAPAGMHPATA
jgi:phage shock protein PspC (stress-responsive transcriptional regulator)